MGHVVDPLGYDKSFDDETYTRREYEKALPFVNLLSSDRGFGKVDESEIERLTGENERLQKELEKTQVSMRQEFEDFKRMIFDELKRDSQ